ncbi:methylated-DNA--[protein]-cysteine S-methyltransferase [candidate division GN15 bacterium]|nr:methylated-DNA--[protein]-cysteine S-methyltransferase [candidate division GN15 bacterium]
MPDKLIYCDLDSPLGPMVAGASDKGVSFLEWHDRGGLERISARVRKRYRCELIDGRNEHLEQLERELADYFDRTLTRFTVPIDITGTTFEQRVWQELLQIPYGQTRSYGEVARLLGSPGGSRAVGRANGANYLAIVIPCHRVIDANGNLHGYGGKVWRKKALLELEAGVAAMNL